MSEQPEDLAKQLLRFARTKPSDFESEPWLWAPLTVALFSAAARIQELEAALARQPKAEPISPDLVAETLGPILDKYAPCVSEIMYENGTQTLRDKIILEAVPALTGGRG